MITYRYVMKAHIFQGGQVAEDVLCGAPNALFHEIDRLDEKVIREKSECC